MIEKRHAFGDVERMMERDADHRSPQADTMRMRRRLRQSHLRSRHGLPAAGMMLADKEFVIAELVGIANQRNIPIESERRIFRRIMQRHHENGKFHSQSLDMSSSSITAGYVMKIHVPRVASS